MALTKVTYSMIQGAVINVLDYGADSTGSSDTTLKLQAAIDACVAGGALYLPNGTYKTTAPLTINKRITFFGDGWGSRIMPAIGFGIAFNVIDVTPSVGFSDDWTGWTFRDFSIQGENEFVAGNGISLNLSGSDSLSNVLIDHVSIFSLGLYSIRNHGTFNFTLQNSSIGSISFDRGTDNLRVSNNLIRNVNPLCRAIAVDCVAGSNNLVIEGNTIVCGTGVSASSLEMIKIVYSGTCSIQNNQFESQGPADGAATRSAIYLEGVSDTATYGPICNTLITGNNFNINGAHFAKVLYFDNVVQPSVNNNLFSVAPTTLPLLFETTAKTISADFSDNFNFEPGDGTSQTAYRASRIKLEPAAYPITASTATNVLTVTAVTGTPLLVGQVIAGTGITEGTTIASQTSGAAGSTGTYTLSTTPGTLTSRQMIALSMLYVDLGQGTIGVRKYVGVGADITFSSGNYEYPSYMKQDDNTVVLIGGGLWATPASGDLLFGVSLPVGFRPANRVVIPVTQLVAADYLPAAIRIESDGGCYIQGANGAATAILIDGASFTRLWG